MILSYRHKFLFIKSAKTAGTSIEIALSSICDPDDIITGISADDEALRASLGFLGPQNDILDESIRNHKGRIPKHNKFYNHMSFDEVEARLAHTLDEFFVFSVERDPVDRFWSKFWFNGGFEKWDSPRQFIEQARRGAVAKGWDLYHSKGRCMADRIFFFEDLTGMMEELSERWGVSLALPEVQAKSKTRPRDRSREVLDDFTREWIRVTFAESTPDTTTPCLLPKHDCLQGPRCITAGHILSNPAQAPADLTQ